MKSKYSGISLVLLILLLLVSCLPRSGDKNQDRRMDDPDARAGEMEAWQDTMELKRGLERQSAFEYYVYASAETTPVQSAEGEDAADDPAIWVNRKDPEKSLVLGTNKTRGINVYDLLGNELQKMNIGMVNNIDLREGFQYRENEVVLVAASNRSINAISIMVLDPLSGRLSDTIANLTAGVDEVYGLCCYHQQDPDVYFVFVNGKGGIVEQWKISGIGENGAQASTLRKSEIQGEMVRSFQLSSQPEGMVADDSKGLLYIGLEQEGIIVVSADPGEEVESSMLPGSDGSNPSIYFDIEGLALFSIRGKDYLIASSQGNFSYAIFRLGAQAAYLGSFIIKEALVDGAEETDGLDLALGAFSSRFPEGIFVVQDGFNTDGDMKRNQNFKYVSFSPIRKMIEAMEDAHASGL